MPSKDELKTLYEKGKGSRNMTPLLKTTGWFAWSGETESYSIVGGVDFTDGFRSWCSRDSSYHSRAFAVRSR
jgi:hypothetical protein